MDYIKGRGGIPKREFCDWQNMVRNINIELDTKVKKRILTNHLLDTFNYHKIVGMKLFKFTVRFLYLDQTANTNIVDDSFLQFSVRFYEQDLVLSWSLLFLYFLKLI